MKQYRITKDNILQDSPNDCYLSPDDPIHELKIASYLGGLGSEQRLQEYKAQQLEINNNTVKDGFISGNDKSRYMKEYNIKPGTPAWFELWYGNKNG
jgi:hypothetical protein